ncbi:MAG: hypothetical protein HZB15_09885 [Actinobacteria bacterium]|nr:hypothetical protein [Actinomycetota bacterium]
MDTRISTTEAELALGTIEQRRHQIIDEVALPTWYWWGLAAGWIALGIISDLDRPWLSVAATVAFGAAHAAVASRVLSGRRRSQRLSVRHDLVGRRVPVLVIGALIVLAAVTAGLGLAADADGARHPATIASVVVAVAIVGGGPGLMAIGRRQVHQRARNA